MTVKRPAANGAVRQDGRSRGGTIQWLDVGFLLHDDDPFGLRGICAP